MTQLLEQAMGEVRKLPDAGQDAIAAIILEEIADDRRWDDAFARSQDQLERLANRVREDIRQRRSVGTPLIWRIESSSWSTAC